MKYLLRTNDWIMTGQYNKLCNTILKFKSLKEILSDFLILLICAFLINLKKRIKCDYFEIPEIVSLHSGLLRKIIALKSGFKDLKILL